jgi:hypothetical protein
MKRNYSRNCSCVPHMHHSHDSLSGKIACAQIANQNRHVWRNYSVPRSRWKTAQKTRRVVRFVTTVLRPINPVASVTLRDLVESVGDCFTLAYEK